MTARQLQQYDRRRQHHHTQRSLKRLQKDFDDWHAWNQEIPGIYVLGAPDPHAKLRSEDASRRARLRQRVRRRAEALLRRLLSMGVESSELLSVARQARDGSTPWRVEEVERHSMAIEALTLRLGLTRPPQDDRPDGVYGPRAIVFDGQQHDCDLTGQHQRFLALALSQREIPIEHLMFKGKNAVWNDRYIRRDDKRNKVSRLLTALNKRLLDAEPPCRIQFHLEKHSDLVTREELGDISRRRVP